MAPKENLPINVRNPPQIKPSTKPIPGHVDDLLIVVVADPTELAAVKTPDAPAILANWTLVVEVGQPMVGQLTALNRP